jgi:UPF0755 protein
MRRKLIYIFSGSGIICLFLLVIIYRLFFGISVYPDDKGSTLYIPSESSYSQLLDTIEANLKVGKPELFDWLARKKNLPGSVRPGKYVIKESLSINALINILRSGRKTPTRITFNNIRTLNQIAGKIGKQIEADSIQIVDFFSDQSNFSADGFTKENIISLFIPDTYEFYWDTDAKELYSRMLREYRLFWNGERLKKADEEGLTPVEVAILASIIDDEVAKKDEKPRIAGVYLNRLKRGIPLQACPTIKYALNDFTISRVLKVHLEIDSPYNTYKHRGFPPGPIGCPSVEGIDAVLNAEKHDYLYFAARADFSGYHNFSRTLAEHNRYAAEYQRELNRRKIYR